MFVNVPKILKNGKVKMTNIKATDITGFEETICPNGEKGTKIYAAGGHFKVEVDQLAVGAALTQALVNKEIVTLQQGTTVAALVSTKAKAYLNA